MVAINSLQKNLALFVNEKIPWFVEMNRSAWMLSQNRRHLEYLLILSFSTMSLICSIRFGCSIIQLAEHPCPTWTSSRKNTIFSYFFTSSNGTALNLCGSSTGFWGVFFWHHTSSTPYCIGTKLNMGRNAMRLGQGVLCMFPSTFCYLLFSCYRVEISVVQNQSKKNRTSKTIWQTHFVCA